MCALRRLLRHEGLKMGFITGLRVVLVQSFGWRAGMRRRPQVSVKFEITKRTAAQAQGRVNRNGRSDFKNKLPRPLHGRQHKCFLKLHDLYVGRRCMVVCPNRRGAHDSDWRRLAGDKRRTQRPPPPPRRTRDSLDAATCCNFTTKHLRRRRAEHSLETAAISCWRRPLHKRALLCPQAGPGHPRGKTRLP